MTRTFDELRAECEQISDWGNGLTLPMKGGNGPRFSEQVDAPVGPHIAGNPDAGLWEPAKPKPKGESRTPKPKAAKALNGSGGAAEWLCAPFEPGEQYRISDAPVPEPCQDAALRAGRLAELAQAAAPEPRALADDEVDRAAAERFLTLLDPAATQFTFQTFDDNKDRRAKTEKDHYARTLTGSLDELFPRLCQFNELGAGIFVTICATDLVRDNRTFKGKRTAENIIGARLVFADLDDAPRPPGLPRVLMGVETSAGSRALYWRPADTALAAFTPLQDAIHACCPGSDKVSDWPRVMRIPGFFHSKIKDGQSKGRFRTRIVEVSEDARAVTLADFVTTARSDAPSIAPTDNADAELWAMLAGLEGRGVVDLESFTEGLTPWEALNAQALTNLREWVPELFGDIAYFQSGTGAYRVKGADMGDDLVRALGRDPAVTYEEDLSIHPSGIIDYGVATDALGNKTGRGGHSPLGLAAAVLGLDLDGAFAWLEERLRGPDADPGQGIPFMITAEMRAALASYGYTPEQIRELTPQQAWEALRVRGWMAGATAPLTESAKPAAPVAIDLWAKFERPLVPFELLPKTIAEFSIDQSARIGCDPAGVVMSALTVAGAAIPDAATIRPQRYGRWRESTRLWCANVGPPAGKKTPGIDAAAYPLKQIDSTLFRAYSEAKQKWDAMALKERREALKRGELPRHLRAVIEDTSVEAVQEIARDSPDGVLCLRDELSGWFGSMDRYACNKNANSDRAFWLQAYNGGEYRFDRIARGSGVSHLGIALLGGIQPDALRMVANDIIDDGLIQRITPIILGPAKLSTDTPVPHTIFSYNDLIHGLHIMKAPAEPIQLSDAALAVRVECEKWHLELAGVYQTLNRKFAAHIGKYDGMLARLTLLWHVIEAIERGEAPAPFVPEETIRRVAEFQRRFLLPHAIAFYSEVFGLCDSHDDVADTAGFILAHKLEYLTNRIMARGSGGMQRLVKDKRTLEAAYHTLEAAGWITRVPGKRPSDPPWFQVNPGVHEQFAARAERERERRAREKAVLAKIFAGLGRA
jgi:hypothetical protein